MEKLNLRIQRSNNLNDVYFDEEKGPGGGYHDYAIVAVGELPEYGSILIPFQKGPRKDPDSRHGVLETDLLEIIRHRLQSFQEGEFRTRENACALTHIEEALMWLNKRIEDRAERGVLGTMKQ